jgi:hypothetical protein
MAGIEADTSKLDEMLSGMLQKLNDFPSAMENELVDWQIDDMKRQYPNIEHPGENVVETDIAPRSIRPHRYIPTGRPRGRPRGPVTSSGKPPPGTKLPPSTRPILREALWDRLVERMDELMEKYFQWDKTSQP